MAFYELEVGRERPLVEGSDANEWESIVCSKNPDHQRAGRRITTLSVDILSRSIPDFTRTMLSDVIVTDRVREALQSAKLTGLIFNPVVVASTPKRRGDATYPKLWELVAVGAGGAADKASGIVKLRECSECRLPRWRRALPRLSDICLRRASRSAFVGPGCARAQAVRSRRGLSRILRARS
jgi:hypothetical protein